MVDSLGLRMISGSEFEVVNSNSGLRMVISSGFKWLSVQDLECSAGWDLQWLTVQNSEWVTVQNLDWLTVQNL